MDNATLFMIIGTVAVPILSGFGSWVAVKVAIAVLKVEMKTVEEKVDRHDSSLEGLKEDALVHDMELETALAALKLTRVRRQRIRD